MRWGLGLAVAAAGLLGGAPAQAADRSFVMSAFDSVVVIGDAAVTIRTGASPAANASGAQADLDQLRFTRNGTQLIVRVQRAALGSAQRGTQPLTITLTTRNLDRVRLEGTGAIAIDRIKAQRASLALIGAGAISVGMLDTDILTVGIAGNGKISLGAGKAGKARVEQNGGGTLEAASFSAGTLDVVHNGPATSRISANGRATLFGSGAGLIEVGGKPDCQIKQSGTTTMRCGAG